MWSETPPSPGPRLSWWRHRMETFSDLLAICGGNSPATGEFPAQRPVTRSFSVFFDLRLNTWLSKLLQGWWFDTPLCPLWRHSNNSACTCTYVSELWDIRMAWMMLIVTNSLRHRDPQLHDLTHPLLCRIYASVNRVSIGSDNGLSSLRRQAII